MDRNGNKIYLDPAEERASGYTSPIDLDTFDLHGERSRADAEIERIQTALTEDDVTLSGELHSQLQRAQARSYITRTIAKSWALETLVSPENPDDPPKPKQ